MAELPRYWRDSNYPRPRSPKVAEDVAVDVYRALNGLAFRYREDSANLATVMAAFARAGYPPGNCVDTLSCGGLMFEPGDYERWGDRRCREVVAAAMRGRRRSVLTARADGMLAALEVHAPAIVFAYIHRVQSRAALIECRRLLTDERIERLREMDRERDAMSAKARSDELWATGRVERVPRDWGTR